MGHPGLLVLLPLLRVKGSLLRNLHNVQGLFQPLRTTDHYSLRLSFLVIFDDNIQEGLSNGNHVP